MRYARSSKNAWSSLDSGSVGPGWGVCVYMAAIPLREFPGVQADPQQQETLGRTAGSCKTGGPS